MATTPIFGLPFLEPADPPSIHGATEALAEAVEGVLNPIENRVDVAETDINALETLLGTGAATSWTPVLTGTTTNPVLGTGGSIAGHWWRVGKLVFATIRITFGTAGISTGSGDYRISLPPVTPSASLVGSGSLAGGDVIGIGSVRDASSPGSSMGGLAVQLASSTTCLAICPNGAALNPAAPFVLAVSDRINLSLSFPVA